MGRMQHITIAIHSNIILCVVHVYTFIVLLVKYHINFAAIYLQPVARLTVQHNTTHVPGQSVGVTLNDTPGMGCGSNRILCEIVCICMCMESNT